MKQLILNCFTLHCFTKKLKGMDAKMTIAKICKITYLKTKEHISNNSHQFKTKCQILVIMQELENC